MASTVASTGPRPVPPRPLPPRASRSETFPHPERCFVWNGVPIRFFDSGPAGAPVIACVHGLGGNLTHFEYLAGPLADEGWRVTGLDLPGFGLSGKPRREYTIAYLAEGLRALLDQLGIAQATLVGHSLGGLVCAALALEAPGRAERLVLLSTAGLFRIPLPLRLAARTFMRQAILGPALELGAAKILDHVLAAQNDRTERFVEQCTTRPDARFVAELARSLSAARRDLVRRHLLDEAERLMVPTLVIWGGSDRLLPSRHVPGWVERLPRGELEVLTGCGHMSLIEDPEAVLARMRAFFRRTEQMALPRGRTTTR